MQPDNFPEGIPARWLVNARADLVISKIDLPDGAIYEQLCFHAQQAVEKSLKAILLKHRIAFPYTHNLQTLLDILPKEVEVPIPCVDIYRLTPFAVTTRYADEGDFISSEEWKQSVEVAEIVFAWASEIIQAD